MSNDLVSDLSIPEFRNDLQEAHDFSSRHETHVRLSARVGCFHCQRIFPAQDIHTWIKERGTPQRTAECPHCGVDAILGDRDVPKLDAALLARMSARYFGR